MTRRRVPKLRQGVSKKGRPGSRRAPAAPATRPRICYGHDRSPRDVLYTSNGLDIHPKRTQTAFSWLKRLFRLTESYQYDMVAIAKTIRR